MKEYIPTPQPIRLAAPRARAEVFTKLMKIPGVQMIYVSALACTRHRNIDFIEMQRKGRLSYLLFNEVDMITGDYIQKTMDAAAEIAAERNPSGIILLTGCQSALLSTDYKLLTEEIEQQIGCPVRVHDGCRLCGFDEEKGGSSSIDQMLYSFITPTEKSTEISVNILGSAQPHEGSELFSILGCAGVKSIHHLTSCKTFADYQEMGSAHLNILTTPQDLPIGHHLEETLGIPYVCLGGIYDDAQLNAAYKQLAKFLNLSIDVAAFGEQLKDKLQQLKQSVGDLPIHVEGDAELAKWLLNEGFPVKSLTLNPHQGLSDTQKVWFQENAPDFRVESPKRGGPHGHGKPPAGHGKADNRQGKPNNKGGLTLNLGYAGSMAALASLERAMGGKEE